ncbi:triose-phosphate isomerase [Cucumibacter marinus]|uniref:triose-phosphate isomerase n=1 Tax=Cucumibacter marinus TaxID=1121252 RepID=UPI00040B53F8|nr:triose-phosphate isomerase [Cucumibacter marinus]
MATAPRKLVAGNWKMNGLRASIDEAVRVADRIEGENTPDCDVLICPPATILAQMGWRLGDSAIGLGGQDCHQDKSGAHTGDLSADMLADVGAKYVIVGHSERRADHHEDDATVRAKAEAALEAGLLPIICVGETESQRESGDAYQVVIAQLVGSLPQEGKPETIVVAYEPVWAIGTGKTASPTDVEQMHAVIRKVLVERYGEIGEGIRILYGGSVKPDNAAELLAIENVDGALVGGASLNAEQFVAIIQAA